MVTARKRKSVRWLIALLCITVFAAFAPGSVYADSEYSVTTDKDEYTVGEAINVTSVGPSGSWVGIYGVDEGDYLDGTQASYWYIDGNKTADITKGTMGTGRPKSLTQLMPGKYTISLMTGGKPPYKEYATKSITVKADDGYDLTVENATINDGEALNIKASVPDSDTEAWVGLYKKGDNVNTDTSATSAMINSDRKETFNLLKDNDTKDRTVPAGEYKLVLIKSGSGNPYIIEKSIDVSIKRIINKDDYKISVDNTKSYASCGKLPVTASAPKDSGAWVAIYKQSDENTNHSKGGKESYFWYYVDGSDDVDKTTGYWKDPADKTTLSWENGKEVDLLHAVSNNRENKDWKNRLDEGTYKIILYGDAGYDYPIQTIENVKITGHEWELTKTESEPTCTDKGSGTYTCKLCGETKQDFIPALGHKLDGKTIVSKKATDKEDGEYAETCTVCHKHVVTGKIAKIASVKTSKSAYAYTGKTIKPIVEVTDADGKTIVENDHYLVTRAKSSKNIGYYTLIVKFQNEYDGTKKLTYTINPKKASLKSVKAGKKTLKASWKKDSKVSGYQVRYSAKKSMKSAKVKTIKSYKTTSYKFSKVKKGKKYVQVRSYKTVKNISGKKVKLYGSWSSVKSAKVR
ncbi:hypothetical protein [Hornefia butyriciproducens]|uniref:hypothetical protein n=1 Tax=Hornefia butyriciproducens TaxID=2652293 RepID=UPI002A91D7C9|nr:hypothetical protein [Hornefia butyriciproducens]MCI7412965.1 hypothetical protein [Clostridiales bacterium]MDY6211161.1 hypothetical protein [Hornefia butyriciproducens]